jgi:hypothetical protein
MTLTELLTAMTIALLIVGILGTTLYTVSTAAARRQSDPSARAGEALLRLGTELSAMTPNTGGEPPFAVTTERATGDGAARLAFCALVSPVEDRDPRWATPQALSYQLDHTHTPPDLIRIARALNDGRDPPLSTTNVVLRGVTRFQVQAFDGSTWSAAWEAGGQALPAAVRLEIEVPVREGHQTYDLHVHVPAATTVPSSRSGVEETGGR